MKFFDELLDKTAKFADEAVKVGKEAFDQTKVVAGDAMEKGKKKVNQMQLEADKKEAFRKLGEIVYLQHRTGEKNESLLAQYLEEIAVIDADIELLASEEVNEKNDYTVTEFTEDEETTLDELKEEVSEAFEETIDEIKEFFDDKKADKICPSCGTKADGEDIFCRGCGTKL